MKDSEHCLRLLFWGSEFALLRQQLSRTLVPRAPVIGAFPDGIIKKICTHLEQS
jgi:hypothetical protein